MTLLEKAKKAEQDYKDAADQQEALVQRAWAKMQESRRDKGYEKRVWWDKNKKYHFDYGDDNEECGDNEFNTGKVGKHNVYEKDLAKKQSEGLPEFGM